MFLRRIHRIPRFGGIQVRNGKRRNVRRSFFFPLHFSHYAATLYYYDPRPTIPLALYALFFGNTYPLPLAKSFENFATFSRAR